MHIALLTEAYELISFKKGDPELNIIPTQLEGPDANNHGLAPRILISPVLRAVA